jgi:hypothetical protein
MVIRKGNPFVEKFLLHHVIARNEANSTLAEYFHAGAVITPTRG